MRHRTCVILTVVLWGAGIAGSPANDVGLHVVASKGQNLAQTNAAGPLVSPTNEPSWFFGSFVAPTGPGTVTNVTVVTPAGSTFPLPYAGDQYETNAGFASQVSLDAAFPNGTYTQTIYAVTDGTKSAGMLLTGDVYPNDPVMSTWTAAQSLDMTGGLTLGWTNFVGGTAADYIQLEVRKFDGTAVARSGEPGQPGSLNGTNTSWFIPAGTFAPGTNYSARLMFAKITGVTNAFPGAIGLTAYLKNNSFDIHTAPQPNLRFFDGFQQWNANTVLTMDTTNYPPIVGSNTVIHIRAGTTTALATNIAGNLWAWLDCSATNSAVHIKCIPTAPIANGIIELGWNLWIQATNAGFGAFSVNLPFAPEEYNPPLAFVDSGLIIAFTNAPIPEQAIVIGNWGALAGTVMTNRLTLNFPARTMSYSLNGQVLTNMTLGAYWTNWVNAVVFAVNEDFADSRGNRFRADDLQITATEEYPPDAHDYVLAKGIFYAQTNSDLPVFAFDTPYAFLAQVTESSSGTVSSAALQLPGGSTWSLIENPEDEMFELKSTFATTASLEGSFPNGTYTFTIVGVHDGTNQAPLTLTGDLYPNAPHISNWTAAQHIVATNDFVLTWDAFSGGTTGDFIHVYIENTSGETCFRTPDPGDPHALTGTNTSITIPAHTLPAGGTYRAQLLFAKATSVNTTNYPGVLGFGAYFTQTDFPLTTAIQDSVGDGIPDWWRALYFGGDGTTTNTLSAATADPDGDGMSNLHEYLAGTVPTNSASAMRITTIARQGTDMNITWTVVPGKTYILQTSTNLLTDSFTNAANQVATLSVPLSAPITLTNAVHVGAATNRPARFYRVRLQTP